MRRRKRESKTARVEEENYRSPMSNDGGKYNKIVWFVCKVLRCMRVACGFANYWWAILGRGEWARCANVDRILAVLVAGSVALRRFKYEVSL